MDLKYLVTPPPIPKRKPAPPSESDEKMKIPPISLTGGAAAPATSGITGTAGNIGDVFIKAGGKNTGFSLWFIALGVAGYLAWRKWGR